VDSSSVPSLVHCALSDSSSSNGDHRENSALLRTVNGVLDMGEGVASDTGDDWFAARHERAENHGFEDNDGKESASASVSNDKEATDKTWGMEEELGDEHEENNDNEEAEELWCALAISLVTAVVREEVGNILLQRRWRPF
jgi:hypothetical protein